MAERQALEDARQRRATTMWNEAKALLEGEVSQQDASDIKTSKVVLLLVLPVLQGQRLAFYGDPEDWQQLVRQVGKELGLFLPWDELFDSDNDQAGQFALLQEMEPVQLLLLAACLLLAHEASQLIRFGGESPGLSYVLGHDRLQQLELGDGERETTQFNETTPGADAKTDNTEDADEEDDFTREGLEEASEEQQGELDELGANDFATAGYDHGGLDDETAEENDIKSDSKNAAENNFEPEGYKRRDKAPDSDEHAPDDTTEEAPMTTSEPELLEREDSQRARTLVTTE